jgi:phospholipase/carboxylesterase
MKFSLNTKIIEPENKENIDNAIILLHGYGGDGQDISMLALGWKRFLKNTVFLCPDAKERCAVNPTGYQWFDLSVDDPKYILEESKKAEIVLLKFIEEVKKKYNLKSSKIILCGFSQGCMMSINLGLIITENYNCVVGFSGKIIDKKDLEKRIKSRTSMLLIHGDSDEIVSPSSLLEAKDFLIRNNVEVKTSMIKNCSHNIPIEASSLALNYIKNNLLL